MASTKGTAGLSGLAAEAASAPAGARRLTDKILDAFTLAYAQGEVDLAAGLRRLLAAHDDPLRRANLWVRFVDSRNRYCAASDERHGDARTAASALEDMKEAYRRWCEG